MESCTICANMFNMIYNIISDIITCLMSDMELYLFYIMQKNKISILFFFCIEASLVIYQEIDDICIDLI